MGWDQATFDSAQAHYDAAEPPEPRERDICDDYAELANACDKLIAFLEESNEGGPSEGYVDTGEVLWLAGAIKDIRDQHEGG